MATFPILAGVTILIVDDNADWLELIAEALTRYGASVSTVESAAEAIRIVKKNPPDVLLSDIAMPGMDGYMLVKRIRKLEARKRVTENKATHLPAAAVSAFTDIEDRRQSFSAGFEFHIPKPVDIGNLVKTVAILATRNPNKQSRALT